MTNQVKISEQEDEQIKSILRPYLNDLWIERRLKLPEIVACLEEKQSRLDDDDGQTLLYKNIHRDLIEFIQFLERYCSGLQLDMLDKQWGELLNLMMISRKLNHKSVKFKDILANKQQIESNSQQIISFNSIVHFGQTIESGLNDLEQLIQSTRIVLSASMNDYNNELKHEHLMETRDYLHKKCQPLLHSLKVSFEDNHEVEKDSRFDMWQMRETKLSAKLRKMSSFILALISLQTKLFKIKYLDHHISSTGSEEIISSNCPIVQSIGRSEVRDSIESCRRELNVVQEFNRKIASLLYQVAAKRPVVVVNMTKNSNNRQNGGGYISLQLMKLFEPKEYIPSGDIQIAIDKLDDCQRKLDEIMQNLRREFGRFYFLNDLELLTIIIIDTKLFSASESEATKRLTVEKSQIICKLYNNSISSFMLDAAQNYIIGVQSPIGEIISFSREDFVPLKKPVQIYSLEVVRILNELQRKLRKTLKSMLMKSVHHQSKSTNHQTTNIDCSLPVQLISLAECIKFCSRVEGVLSTGNDDDDDDGYEVKFDELIHLYEEQSRLLSQQVFAASETIKDTGKIYAAISMNVHFISLLMSMKQEKLSRVNDWFWQKQVRYYIINNDDDDDEVLEVRIADAKFGYKFDYLCVEQQQQHHLHQSATASNRENNKPSMNNFKRLISTKITERCFLLASQAVYHLRLGANPYGPAGGGKTETIKALGHLLGRQVIVHNCDETNDIESLDRLIWGLAHSGLWGCFDEFNRLSASTMSVISATLELVQSSIRENKTTILTTPSDIQQFDNDISKHHHDAEGMMCINQDSAFFITLNPATSSTIDATVRLTGDPNQQGTLHVSTVGEKSGRSYKGRRRLPANLRSLFLPISMVRVQIDSIVRENLLALSIEINQNNERKHSNIINTDDTTCDSKIVEFSLKMEQFIHQLRQLNFGSDRCEWDLRLVMASLQRLEILVAKSLGGQESSSTNEDRRVIDLSELMLRAFFIEVEPRLSADEFVQLLTLSRQHFDCLLKEESSSSSNNTKVHHLERQLETRTGVLLYGSTKSAGKSSTWKSLLLPLDDSENRSSSTTRNWIALNPKFCSQQEFFGGFSDGGQGGRQQNTEETHNGRKRKWVDGYFTAKVREAIDLLLQDSELRQVCLILDGPIDPDWVESLNSVLDDNRVLTLSSGERLNFFLPASQQSIKLIFETDSLELASPATISRLGLVYFEKPNNESQFALNEVHLEHIHEVDLSQLQQDNPDWGLMIVCGQRLDHQAIECFSRQKISTQCEIYSCSSSTNSNHLIDLISNWSPTTNTELYIFHNVHLIKAQDQWGTKTFFEMLRFLIEYRGYYDNQTFAFKPIQDKVKFILIGEKLNQIEQRLARKSDLTVFLKPSPSHQVQSGCNKKLELDTEIEIGKVLRQDSALIILKNNIHMSITEINQHLSSSASGYLDKNEKIKVHLFSDSLMANESMACLETQLIADDKNDDETSNFKRKFLFVLHSLELNLIDRKLKGQLLHLLNRLRGISTYKRMKFIFVCDSSNSANSEILNQFESISGCKVFVLEESDLTSNHNLKNVLNKTFRQEPKNVLTWLEERIFNSLVVSSKDKEMLESLVNAFLRLYQESNSRLLLQQKALKNGLNHLSKFDKQVEQMRTDCNQQELILIEKDAQIEQTSAEIEKSLRESEQQREQVNKLGGKLALKRSIILKKSEQLELELAQVNPMLEKSQSEIRQHLKPEALNEIKTLRAPPKTIKDILDALFILLGAKDLSWNEIKSYLATKSLRDELTNYQFEKRINEGMIKSVQDLITARADSFNADQAKRASRAIVHLLSWIQSALEYGKVLIKSGPLRSELTQLNLDLEKLNESVQMAEVELEKINENIRQQERDLLELKEESKKLKKESCEIQEQLQESQQLRLNLESQTNRWDQDLHNINSLISIEDPSSGDSNDNNHRLIIKLCSMVTNLAFNYATTTTDNHAKAMLPELHAWLKQYDLHDTNIKQKLESWNDFICGSQLSSLLDLDIAELETIHRTSSSSSENNDSRIVQLTVLKLFIEFVESPIWLPFIPVDGSSDDDDDDDDDDEMFGEQEILESLCYGNIIGYQKSEILYVRFQSNLDRLQQSLSTFAATTTSTDNTNINCRHKKRLVCLDVRKIQDDESQLNLAHFILFDGQSPAAAAAINYKFILVGSRKGKFEQKLSRYLVGLDSIIKHQKSDLNLNQVQSSIVNSLLNLDEPTLMKDLDRKRLDLQKKQKNMRMNEITLLNQLVVTTTTTTTNKRQNFADVVRVLSELQQTNLELSNDWKLLEELNDHLNSKRLQYMEISLGYASFYLELLAPLKGFNRLSVKKYIQLLLLSSYEQKQQQTADVVTLQSSSSYERLAKTNKRLIVRHAMHSMDPQQRLEFVKKLADSTEFNNDATTKTTLASGRSRFKQDDDDDDEFMSAAGKKEKNIGRQQAKTQLGKTILRDILSENSNIKQSSRRWLTDRCQLVVVLHDPSKSSSPQQDIDYLFTVCRGGAAAAAAATTTVASLPGIAVMSYEKVYATGDRLGQVKLEAAIRKFAAAAPTTTTTTTKNDNNNNNNNDPEKVRCLCVMNAHLSTSWLNANLVDCLQENHPNDNGADPQVSSSSTTGSGSRRRGNGHKDHDWIRVIILIGETSEPSSSSSGSCLFDRRLLDYARLRYWHDELALSLIDRFDTFVGSLTNSTTTTTTTTSNYKDNSELERQLILFHVVLQERVKMSGDSKEGNITNTQSIPWLHSYNFDYDQLQLALKTLSRLAGTTNGKDLLEADLALRANLSDYLLDIVYGSRMETIEDELELERLIERFVRSKESAQTQVLILEELRNLVASNRQQQQQQQGEEEADRVLRKLIGFSAQL